jgi:hypothetical protein
MTKWIVALAYLYLVGGLCCMLIEHDWYAGSGSFSSIDTLLHGYQKFSFSWNPVTGMISAAQVVWEYIQAMFKIITWDYPFFTGGLRIFQVALTCLSLGILVATIWSMISRSSPT